MRRHLSLTVLASALLLAACTSGSEPAPTTPSASVPASSSPSASAPSPTPTPTASTPPGTAIPASITGMHVAGVQDGAWPDSNVPFGALRLWDSGTAWSQIETVQGTYDWTLLDRAVANAEENGVEDILLVLGSTPTWNAKRIADGDYPVPGAASAPRSLKAWDAFVEATVQRYTGRITAYQVWNEASLAMFWDGTPELMADLTERAYDIIKRIDPAATVVAASTTVRLPGAFDRFFPDYLAALGERGWPIDVFAAHLYPASRGTTDERAAFVEQVSGALQAAEAPELPVWDTELNYGLAGPGPSNPLQTIEGARARDWVVQTTLDSLSLGISRTYWYIWTPEPYALLGMQLTNDSGAVEGLRVVDQWLVGGSSSGCTVDGAVTSCEVAKNGVPSVIVWSASGRVTVPVPEGITQACNTANRCRDVAGTLEVGETPQRLTP